MIGCFRYFFAAVTSAAVLCVFVIITSIIFLAALYSDGEKLPVNHPFLNITASTDPSTEPPDSTKVCFHSFLNGRPKRYMDEHFYDCLTSLF